MSKQLRHPLATLLRLRRQREDRARQGLVRARGDADAIRRQLSLLRLSWAECDAAARQTLLESGAPGDLSGYRMRVRGIRNELSRQAIDLLVAEETLAHRRQEVARAIKRRRVLERLEKEFAKAEALGRARRDQKESAEAYAAFRAVGSGRQPADPEPSPRPDG